MAKCFCVFYEGHSSNRYEFNFFLVIKYNTFLNIIKKFRDVIVPGFLDAIMVSFLFCGISFLYQFLLSFRVSDNSSSTCIVEEATDSFYCVIVSFLVKSLLSVALTMPAVREQFFLIGGSNTASDSTYLWVSEGLPGVLKQDISSMDDEELFGTLGRSF